MDIASYGQHAIDLANTWDPTRDDPEGLPDVDAARDFLSGRVRGAERAADADLELLRAVRQELRDVMTAPDDLSAVERLNDLLRRFPVHPLVAGHDAKDWHLHLSGDDRAPGEFLVATAAFGLAVWLLDVGMDRRGQCAEDTSGCWDVFVDTSRNHSRRYCSTTCSNRANVAAHRARQRAQRE